MPKDYTEEELFDLSNEELESAVKELRKEDITTDEGDDNGEVQEQEEEEVTKQSNDSTEDSEVEQATTENEPIEEDSNKPTTYKVKANGQEYDFSIDEMLKLVPKALDYTKKTQYIAPYRKTISAMEENGISQDDINLLIDMKKGNKDAIAKFLQSSEIDTFDLPEKDDINYTPQDYGIDNNQAELEEVITTLRQDQDGFTKVNEALSKFDDTSKGMLYSQPQLLLGLDDDIKSGLYDKIMPEVNKVAALDGFNKPILEYYAMVGQRVIQQEQIKAANEAKLKQQKEQTYKDNKKKASIPSTISAEVQKDIQNASDINTDDFWKWRKSIEK